MCLCITAAVYVLVVFFGSTCAVELECISIHLKLEGDYVDS